MLTFILHTCFLLISVGVTYLWTKNPTLNSFNLQAVGLLILFYFGGKLLSKSQQKIMNILDAVVLTSLIMFLVLTSGGIHSSLFFLLYFLLFGLSLLFEPTQSFFLSLSLIVVFGIDAGFKFDQAGLINLLSLLLITPLASVFGRKYLEGLEESGQIKRLNQIVAEDETETLFWLSTKAKPTLINLLDTTSQIIGSNLLPTRLQEKLKDLHRDLINLHQSASTLEDDIDKRSDD